MEVLSGLLDQPHTFLQPTKGHQDSTINLAKTFLDPLAKSIIEQQTKRRNENRKRKREDSDQVLQLRQVYTKGFGVKQVWEQARRILDAACIEIERQVDDLEIDKAADVEQGDINGVNEDSTDGEEDLVEDGEDLVEDEEALEDSGDLDEEDIEVGSDVEMSDEEIQQPTSEYIQDRHGLNDGFFSIDDFNKQSQFLEQMDARGDDDDPSDEDDIDWAADPMTENFQKPKAIEATFEDEESDEDEDDAEDMDDVMGISNANEIKYADFFEPPPKKPSKTKRMRALPKTQPETDDIERAIADVRRDLLDSDEEPEELDDKTMSTHEKQKAAIAAEIKRLEAANVAKRDWQMSGEARAVDRPINSLIEEDLEFERAGKPVPVITAETSEEIEQLIKRRILAREFDEVIRKIGGSVNETRRGRVEIDDKKSQAGLGEIYEQEHQDLTYVDKRSAATKRQHQEIDILWKEVNDQLNLLSNLHFKPKRLDLEVKTVEDKPRIVMEDARPVGEDGEDMLAPQEIYQGRTLINKEEMTREEKLRKRRRNKERGKKSQKPTKEKSNIIDDLKKGNVKVIGKDGDLQSLGKSKVEAGIIASNMKL